MSVFDEILAAATEEDKIALNRYPKLKEALAEAETLATRVPKLEADFREADGYRQNWKTWAAENYDFDAKDTKSAVALRQQNQELQQRVAVLESTGGDMPSFEDIEKYLQTKGYVPKAELEPLIGERLKTAVDKTTLDQAVNNLVGNMTTIWNKTADLPSRHRGEFNEPIDNLSFKFQGNDGRPLEFTGMEAVTAYMSINNERDPRRAYDSLVASRREEARKTAETVRQKEIDDKLAAAKAEGVALGKKEAAMSMAGHSPTDLSGSSPAMGHLQAKRLKLARPEGAPDLDKFELGKGQITQAILKDIAEKGTETVQ